ncbi:alpha/beta fold hydrolase [Dongia sp.]|uniref:alpha/beta fold hydrolase n=1 Tax=Dongia sp. TaxID=1977262 RepID=UPI003752B249
MEFTRDQIGPTVFFATPPETGKRNLLMLHGALGSSERIMHLASGFDDFNLLFCDLKGHGQSEKAAGGYDPATLAGELIAPINASFGAAPFAVVAESFSGIVALDLARRTQQLQCLAMVDTPFDNQRMPDSLVALVRAYQSRAEQREAIAGVSAGFFGLDVVARKVRPLSYFDRLEGLRLPLLMVSGTRKAVDHPKAPEPGAYFSEQDRARIGAAYQGPFSVVEIAGAGHRLLKTHPDLAIAAIRPFLEQYATLPAA